MGLKELEEKVSSLLPENITQVTGRIQTWGERKPRKHIPAHVRRQVLIRDNHRCVVCGKNEHLHLDHIIPQSRGGASTLKNLQVLCAACNTHKGIGALNELSFQVGYPIVIRDEHETHCYDLAEIPGYNKRQFVIVTPAYHDWPSFENAIHNSDTFPLASRVLEPPILFTANSVYYRTHAWYLFKEVCVLFGWNFQRVIKDTYYGK